jgi:hypothetical protein
MGPIGFPDWLSHPANMSPCSHKPFKHHLELVSYFHVDLYIDCCPLHTESLLPMAVPSIPIAHALHSFILSSSNHYSFSSITLAA